MHIIRFCGNIKENLSIGRMKFLESVTLYSCHNLKTLQDILKEDFPNKMIQVEEKKNSYYRIYIDTRYITRFCQIFSKWLHGIRWKMEVESAMNDIFMLTAAEKEGISSLLPTYIQKSQDVLEEIINQKIYIMLSNFKKLNLEGFTKFCLREYKAYIQDIIELCFQKFLEEKEYHEFVELLKYFIEVEECQMKTLNVVAENNGTYCFFDSAFHNITSDCIELLQTEYPAENLESEDELLTILISMLPEHIRIYGASNIDNKPFIKTLKMIFGDRIKFVSESKT